MPGTDQTKQEKKNNAIRLDYFFVFIINELTLPWQAWTKISLGFPAKLEHLSAVS